MTGYIHLGDSMIFISVILLKYPLLKVFIRWRSLKIPINNKPAKKAIPCQSITTHPPFLTIYDIFLLL